MPHFCMRNVNNCLWVYYIAKDIMLTVFYSNRVYTLTLLEHSYNAFKTYIIYEFAKLFYPGAQRYIGTYQLFIPIT